MIDGHARYSTLHTAHGFDGPGFEPAALCDDGCGETAEDCRCEILEIDRIENLYDEAARLGDPDLAALCLRFLEDADEAALAELRRMQA